MPRKPSITISAEAGTRRSCDLAFHQLDRRAAYCANDIIFADALRHRRAGRESERRLPAHRDGDRHLGRAAVLPGGDVLAEVLRAPHQDRHVVLVGDHAAIDADIHHAGFRIARDAAAVGLQVAAAVDPVPPRGGKRVEIDVVALEDVLLARAGVDDLRRDRSGEDGAADLDQLARMRVGRQPEHHGDAAIAVERRAEDAAAAAVVGLL